MKHLRSVLKAQGVAIHSTQWLAGAVAAGALAALGQYNLEGLLAVPTDVATMKLRSEPLPAGQTALEVAFWLSVLVSNYLAFRALELFLRDKAARMFRDLPIPPATVFFARLSVLVQESLFVSVIVSAFFVPLLFQNSAIALSAIGVVFSGLLFSGFAAVGCILYVGIELGGGRTTARDAYGGIGAAFIYGPVLGFGASALLCLLVKLGFGEFLRSQHVTNAFWASMLIAGGATTFAIFSAFRSFRGSYHALAAAFEEADATTFDLGQEYQTSDYPGASRTYGWFGAFARASELQYVRNHPVSKLFERAWIVVAAIFFATRPLEAMPLIAPLIAVLVPFGLFGNPWDRGFELPGDPLVSARESTRAIGSMVTTEIAIRFALTVSVVFGVVFFRAPDLIRDYALTGGAALLTFTAIAVWSRRNSSAFRWVPRLLSGFVIITAFLSPLIGFFTAIVICAVAAVVPQERESFA